MRAGAGAEERLLAASTTDGPRIDADAVARAMQDIAGLSLSADQLAAVQVIATSGRDVDVLVGPAGSGKTRMLRALLAAWEHAFGTGSVLGLAPSATAAGELADALGIACENTAKWLHETNPATGQQRIHAIEDRYRLRVGQLLIVDEASLAGTFTLDTLARQTPGGRRETAAGRRPSTTIIGGRRRRLRTARHPDQRRRTDLAVAVRQPWEAAAGQNYASATPTASTPTRHTGGCTKDPPEAMAAEAYRAWATANLAGEHALLIAADNATVADLNTQARVPGCAPGSSNRRGPPA